jgi:hypothetical protein
MCRPAQTGTFNHVAEHYDVIIAGSGAGGGTLAHTLAPSGKRFGADPARTTAPAPDILIPTAKGHGR